MKQCCGKKHVYVKAVELKTMTRYYRELTLNLFEMRKKMKNHALLSPTEKGEANRYLKAESDATMWKEECAKVKGS
jgi:hypothetical protein